MACRACLELRWEYASTAGPATSSGGGHAPNYLPGLGTFLRAAKFTLVVCRDCGLTRFFASPEARAKLKESGKWKSI